MKRTTAVIGLVCAFAVTVSAQSINIEFGDPETGPSDSYGAVGLPGYWNVLPGTNFGDYALIGIENNTITASVRQIGGTELVVSDDPNTSGEDEALLDDYIVSYTNIEVCLFFRALVPGRYEVISYAYTPNLDNVSIVTIDNTPDPAVQVGGGVWSGSHEDGVTYTIHRVNVGADTRLGSHSGIVIGAKNSDRGALNGIQLRLLPPMIPGDLNCDGTVSVGDINAFVMALTDLDAYRVQFPTCDHERADLNEDGNVSVGDIGGFVELLLG